MGTGSEIGSYESRLGRVREHSCMQFRTGEGCSIVRGVRLFATRGEGVGVEGEVVEGEGTAEAVKSEEL